MKKVDTELPQRLLAYVRETYRPKSVLLYGSYADGTQDGDSDFDALVVANVPRPSHDSSVVDGVRMDVFIHPPSDFKGDWEPGDYPQLYDAKIMLDEDGLAADILAKVRNAVDSVPLPDPADALDDLKWCEKMLRRVGRGDAEGFFRWHWLLTDSLEISFALRGWRYFGPKKALTRMKAEDAEGFRIYQRALSSFTVESLSDWLDYMKRLQPKTDRSL